jgi:long-chain acyl-CoA synthetase
MSLVSDLLNGVLAIDRCADAIEFERRWYSWGELGDMVNGVRGALGELGLGAEARVGIMLQTRPGPLAAMLATVSIEACLVSVNPLLPDDRLVRDLAALRLPVVIAESSDLAREGVAGALAAAGTAVIELQGVLDGVVLKPIPAPVEPPPRATEPGIIIEMLSSGTTGPPKRIPLKRVAFEKSFVAALSYEKGRNAKEAPRLRSGVTILAAPMTHIGGLWGALTCVLGGRQSCLLQKFSVDLWLDAVVRHRPKVAGAVPAALRMILDANVPREDLSSLIAIRTGAAPLDPATTQEFWERYRIPVLQNYGATEFSGAIAGWTLDDFHAFRETKGTSVGRFQPGVVGQIVDPDHGTVLSAGAEGILEVCSEQFGDGAAWQRTTDRAAIDADGFLYILGRADNAIIRGGFKVHPDDVVVAIEQHPAVREAVVVGIADKRLGAVPAAVLMLKNGAARPSNEELGSFLRDRLLPYQVPTRFLIVDDVPRTGSFKPALPQVRELFDAAGAA